MPANNIFLYTEVQKTDFGFTSNGEFYQITQEQYIEIEKVILEKRLHTFIPDVIVFSRGKMLIVEIAVTHFVGRTKINEIRKIGISAVEIDLSEIDADFRNEDVENLLIHNVDRKHWLYNDLAAKKQVKEQRKKNYEIESANRKRYREIIRRTSKSGDRIYFQVDSCPLGKRRFDKLLYANVEADCKYCEHFKGIIDNGQMLICSFHGVPVNQ